MITMESANLHHQQQQQHHQLQENNNLVVGSSSSSLAAAAAIPYAVGNKHAWTPSAMATTLSNNSGNSSNSSLDLLNTNSMGPDLGFHWLNNITTDQQSAHDLSRIKDELSSSSSSDHHHHHHHNSFPKLTDLLTSGATADHDQYYQFMRNDLSEKLLLKTLSSSGNLYNSNEHNQQLLLQNNNYSNMNIGGPMGSRSGGHFSQIYPSINVSNLNRSLSSSSMSSSGLDMSLQAMDLLGASARFSPAAGTSTSTTSGTFSTQPNYSFGSLHQQMHQSPDHHHRISCYENEITEVKRPAPAASLMEPKAATQPKKSRLDSRSTSCPPFKVRKEKLGDRIASLQQLVAPYGKTDTASVLMEAIGYIKFLQNQVETLSVPYMKSSRNKSSKPIHAGVTEMNGTGETKRDLRSRGLCLVPLSCMSYVTGELGGASGSVWPAPDFGGGGTQSDFL